MPSLLSKWKHTRSESKQSSLSGGDTKANADIPLRSEAASRKPSPTTIVPEVAESEHSLQGRLWNQAYDAIKAADPELAEAYERILSTEIRWEDSETGPDADASASASAVRNDIAPSRESRAVQMQQLVQIGLKKTQRDAAVKQKMGDGMAAIAAIKGIIDKAVQASPEAAIAWVGVSFALEILSNPIIEAGLHRSGITYVVTRMDWYWNLAGLLLDENKAHASSVGLRAELEKHVLELYQQLLAFQIKSICVHYKNKALNFLRDLFQLDDWGGRLQGIKESECAVRKDSEQFNTQQVRLYLHNMAETASSQQNKLQDIHAALQAHSAQQKDLYEDENYKKCIKDLRDVDPRDDKTRIEKAKGGLLSDCCRWLFHHGDFLRWRDEPDCRVLWIKGDPGKGKTMLLCSTINELAATDAELSYFFCQATETKLSNAAAILRGLIYMLVAQQPLLVSHVRAKYDEAGKALFDDNNAWQALSKILTEILADGRLGQTVLFIDALDECVTDMMELIDYVITQSASTTTTVKWVVTSRNWLSIEEKLLGVDGVVPLHLENLDNDPVAMAVGAFIEYKVDRLAQHKKYKPDTKAHVFEYLSSNANNTFLGVALVCQDLAEPKVRERHTLTRLHMFPAGLEPLYKRMLAQIDEEIDAEVCKQILATMTVLYRPVSLHELTCLRKELSEFEEDLEPLEEIISLCGSFLELRDGMVSFIHKSAKDFLQKADCVVPANGRPQLHRGIFLQSLEALSNTLRHDMYGLAAPGAHIESILTPTPDPLRSIRYACVYLVDHLEDSKEPDECFEDEFCLRDGGSLYEFFRTKYLYWLESLSLHRSIAQGCAAITKLGVLLSGTQSSQLIAQVYDASRFLLAHRTIIETTPLQIYVSALLFSPTQSIVRTLYGGYIPAWVKQAPAVPKTWSSVVQKLDGHSGSVYEMAQAPVQRWLATASDDNTVKIWDLVSGQCLHTLEDHSPMTTQLRYPTIKETESLPKEMRPVRQVPMERRNGVQCVHITADETLLAYGLVDGTIWVWNLRKSQKPSLLCTIEAEWVDGAPRSVVSVSLSNSRTLVSVVDFNLSIKIWDLSTVACIHALKGHTRQITKAVISSDGKRVASCSLSGSIRIWCPMTGKCLRTLFEGTESIHCIVFSPDSRQLASSTGYNTVQLWDTETGICLRSFDGHRDRVDVLSFRPDGRQLVSGSSDGTIKIWDLATDGHSPPLSIPFPPGAHYVALSQDGQRLVAGSLSTRAPVILDVTSTEAYEEKTIYTSLASLAVLRTQPLAASCVSIALGTCVIWDLSTGQSLPTIWAFSGMFRDWEIEVLMAFSESGRWLVVTDLTDMETVLVDVKAERGSQAQRSTIKPAGAPVDCAFSSDSRWLVMASEGTKHMIQVWDMEKRADEWSAERFFTAAPGPLGETFVYCEEGDEGLGDGGRDASTQYALRTMAFSAATGLLAVGCSSRSHEDHDLCIYDDNYCKGYLGDNPEPFAVLVLDIITGVCVRALAGHQAPVGRVAFSEDGTRIASIDSYKEVRIWDAESGDCVNIFRIEAFVYNLEFCPGSSSRLLTEHGQISFDSHVDAAGSDGDLPLATYHGFHMSDGWIWNGTERVLKLPAEHVPDRKVHGNLVRPKPDGRSTTVFIPSPGSKVLWFELEDYES